VELLLLEGGAGLEIWVVDASTGKTTFREVVLGLYEPREGPEVIAIRLVETLRAALIEFASPRTSSPRVRWIAPMSTDVDASSRAPAGRFKVAVGAGAAYSSGGLGATGHLDISFAWRIAPRFTVAADGVLTPVRTKLRGPEGEANVAWYLAGPSLGFCASDPSAPVRFRSGAGLWVAWMNVSGQASAPYVNTRADIVRAIPHFDAEARTRCLRAS